MSLILKDNEVDIWQTSVSLFVDNKALEELQALLTESEQKSIQLIQRPSEVLIPIMTE